MSCNLAFTLCGGKGAEQDEQTKQVFFVQVALWLVKSQKVGS